MAKYIELHNVYKIKDNEDARLLLNVDKIVSINPDYTSALGDTQKECCCVHCVNAFYAVIEPYEQVKKMIIEVEEK